MCSRDDRICFLHFWGSEPKSSLCPQLCRVPLTVQQEGVLQIILRPCLDVWELQHGTKLRRNSWGRSHEGRASGSGGSSRGCRDSSSRSCSSCRRRSSSSISSSRGRGSCSRPRCCGARGGACTQGGILAHWTDKILHALSSVFVGHVRDYQRGWWVLPWRESLQGHWFRLLTTSPLAATDTRVACLHGEHVGGEGKQILHLPLYHSSMGFVLKLDDRSWAVGSDRRGPDLVLQKAKTICRPPVVPTDPGHCSRKWLHLNCSLSLHADGTERDGRGWNSIDVGPRCWRPSRPTCPISHSKLEKIYAIFLEADVVRNVKGTGRP
mmetsp:Transcript_33460/g.72395  ORF Transcript_33460/g.72395 Transcript_33460/m.72395 type:complete len:323 (+) Transcript_33460:1144-2112(+)